MEGLLPTANIKQRGLISANDYLLGVPLNRYTDKKTVYRIVKNINDSTSSWAQGLIVIHGCKNGQPVSEVLSLAVDTSRAEVFTSGNYPIYKDSMKNVYVEVNAYSTISVNFLSAISLAYDFELTEASVDVSTLTKIL